MKMGNFITKQEKSGNLETIIGMPGSPVKKLAQPPGAERMDPELGLM